MESKYNEATRNRPEGDRAVDAPVITIDIQDLVQQIKKEKAWDKNDRNAITAFKSDKLSIVLVAMRKNATMTTEHPENILSVQVLKGRLKLQTSGKTVEVGEENIFVLHERIPYTIEAVKKSVFLLMVVE
jgi:quercetin dioxygenase-like cupin family protein